MNTITMTVYKYDELPEESKDKAIDKNFYINVDGDYWFDYDGKTGFTAKEMSRMHYTKDDAEELLTYKHLYFDIDRGGYIDFDGAVFAKDETARKFLRVPKSLWNRVYWAIATRGRETSTSLEYEPQDNDREFTTKQTEILNRAVEIFADKVNEALHDLRNTYQYLVSREAIEETIRANDYDFDLDGNIC